MLKNREIIYNDYIEFIEHKTGKRVVSYKRLMDTMQTLIIFTNNTCCYVEDGMSLDDEIVFHPLPKSICSCCGEDSHCGEINWKGQCSIYVRNFWGKVRKIYWHRYSQKKNIKEL